MLCRNFSPNHCRKSELKKKKGLQIPSGPALGAWIAFVIPPWHTVEARPARALLNTHEISRNIPLHKCRHDMLLLCTWCEEGCSAGLLPLPATHNYSWTSLPLNNVTHLQPFAVSALLEIMSLCSSLSLSFPSRTHSLSLHQQMDEKCRYHCFF